MTFTTPDLGPAPLAINIEDETLSNDNFRTTRWTGKFLQMTYMTIPVGGEIGAEVHDDHDQFLRVEAGSGHAMVGVGTSPDDLAVDENIVDDWALFIPAGHWHNVINTGDEPLRLYSIYAAPEHVHGTVHRTKADADADPNEQH